MLLLLLPVLILLSGLWLELALENKKRLFPQGKSSGSVLEMATAGEAKRVVLEPTLGCEALKGTGKGGGIY